MQIRYHNIVRRAVPVPAVAVVNGLVWLFCSFIELVSYIYLFRDFNKYWNILNIRLILNTRVRLHFFFFFFIACNNKQQLRHFPYKLNELFRLQPQNQENFTANTDILESRIVDQVGLNIHPFHKLNSQNHVRGRESGVVRQKLYLSSYRKMGWIHRVFFKCFMMHNKNFKQ